MAVVARAGAEKSDAYACLMTTLGDCLTTLDAWFPLALAEDWDEVGLLCGRRVAPVTGIALAVDITDVTVSWAIEQQAQLLAVHHPLFLRGTSSVDGDTPKGSLVHRAIEAGLAIHVMHTNADHARPGVSDAIADALGVVETRPIRPSAHNADVGTGRVGALSDPCTLAAFAELVAAVMPNARGGIRWAGDGGRHVSRVAICGGSGSELLDEVDADVYVTSDLKHHVALDYLMSGRAALIDVPHAVAEAMWLTPLAARLEREFPGVRCTVYPGSTDPWSATIA